MLIELVLDKFMWWPISVGLSKKTGRHEMQERPGFLYVWDHWHCESLSLSYACYVFFCYVVKDLEGTKEKTNI